MTNTIHFKDKQRIKSSLEMLARKLLESVKWDEATVASLIRH